MLGEQALLVVRVVARRGGAAEVGKALADSGPEPPVATSRRRTRTSGRVMARSARVQCHVPSANDSGRRSPLFSDVVRDRRRRRPDETRARDRPGDSVSGPIRWTPRRSARRSSVCTGRPSSRTASRRAPWNADISTSERGDDRPSGPVFTIVHDASAPIHRHVHASSCFARKESRHPRRCRPAASAPSTAKTRPSSKRAATLQAVRQRAVGEPSSLWRCRAARAGACTRPPRASAARFGSVQSSNGRSSSVTR